MIHSFLSNFFYILSFLIFTVFLHMFVTYSLISLVRFCSHPFLTLPSQSRNILSYPILSYPILSYPILSYPILSYPIPYSSPLLFSSLPFSNTLSTYYDNPFLFNFIRIYPIMFSSMSPPASGLCVLSCDNGSTLCQKQSTYILKR